LGLQSALDWIAWAGIVIPLAALAWAAVQHVQIQRRDEKRRQFDEFFEVMDKIGQAEGSIASKMAAVYQLRKYPQYREVIIRFCRGAEVRGDGTTREMFQRELTLLEKHFSKEME
jgi:hypothetical protein